MREPDYKSYSFWVVDDISDSTQWDRSYPSEQMDAFMNPSIMKELCTIAAENVFNNGDGEDWMGWNDDIFVMVAPSYEEGPPAAFAVRCEFSPTFSSSGPVVLP